MQRLFKDFKFWGSLHIFKDFCRTTGRSITQYLEPFLFCSRKMELLVTLGDSAQKNRFLYSLQVTSSALEESSFSPTRLEVNLNSKREL